jgi:hypothetical protein
LESSFTKEFVDAGHGGILARRAKEDGKFGPSLGYIERSFLKKKKKSLHLYSIFLLLTF